jgi:biotin carboxyl carrier protein
MELIINNNNTIQVELEDLNAALVNGERKNYDLLKIGDNHYNIIVDNKSYNLNVIEKSVANANTTLQINGTTFEVHTKDELEKILEKMGMSLGGSAKIKDIKAPMPGLVLNVLVQIGQAIQKDEPILVLEAMKMENSIKSPVEGVIETISIKNGDKVDKNQVLITFA